MREFIKHMFLPPPPPSPSSLFIYLLHAAPMLGNMPSSIPNLPVFTGSSCGSDSTMNTDNITSIITSNTLSATMANENAAQSQLAWLLPALSYAASNVQKPSDRILVAPGFPTLPKQLLDKIHRGSMWIL